MKVLIIGGVAGGATAAARIRRLDENAEIVVIEKSGFVSYANCGLPYYIGGVIEDERELTLQTPKGFWKRFRIDVRTRSEALSIDTRNKTVTISDLDEEKIYRESYDKLLLSPGAKPVKPEMEGTDEEGVFTLRTVEDTLRIREYAVKNKPKTAVIAGGGFIGLEVAENLVNMGVDVTIVQGPSQVLAPLDEDMASVIQMYLRDKGVKLMLGTRVTGIEKDGDSVTARLDSGVSLQSDMTLLAIGVMPESRLARDAGLKLGLKDSIVVNDKMETSEPDIYAVGDAIEVRHFVTGQKVLLSMAGPANKQGRIAADNICGGNSRFTGSQGSFIIKLFEMTAASTGINERTAKALGLKYDKVVLSPASHATYYPGAQNMILKVIYEKETLRILGAQAVGYSSVDKRIDVLATAIHAGITATDLKELDLAYAPPYSSAKDPVNMAGFMIENIEDGFVKQFHHDEIDQLPKDGSVVLLDVRTIREYDRGHVDGFINIPVDDLRGRLDEIPEGKPVYVICQSGLRSYLASRILAQEGFDCYNFSGGYGFYSTVMKDKNIAKASYPCGMEKQ